MKKSGLADSPLFKTSSKIDATPSPSDEKESVGAKESTNRSKPVTPRHHDINLSIIPPINHSINPSINHDVNQPIHHDTTIEIIRGELKRFGKEATTIRFTQEEKKGIEDLVYAFKRKNIKTNTNEITRISVNYILQDHKEKGNQSILTLVIQALNR